ncbi:hypothetical protein [Phaeobacter sp. NW0010-22]|uniref:hypothetical protein n=1 Tax=Phaeobacter sp. NW0010-22 TaxID=3135907 RepID=UPI00333ED33E
MITKAIQTAMQLIFHTGAHATDEDRLLKVLLTNKEGFAQRGIAVPGPGKYRPLLKDTFSALEASPPSSDARDVLLDAILDEEVADRILMTHQHFFGTQWSAIRDGVFYPLAGPRVAQLKQVFEYDQVEIFMSIRNPATFVPAVLAKTAPKRQQQVLDEIDFLSLRWSDMVQRIRDAAPDVPLTIWCNEDTPLIWAQIIRDLAGLDHGTKFTGGFSLLSEIMSKEGMKRFRAYLHQYPEMTEMQKRRVIAAFLDKYAIEDAVEEELDLPGWTEELVDQLTELYDEDVFAIQRIPGVQFIEP